MAFWVNTWSKTEIIQGMSVKAKLSRRYGVKSKKIGVIVKIKFFRRDGVKSKKNWRDGVNFGSAGGASSIGKSWLLRFINPR